MPEPDLGASPRILRAAGLTRDPFAELGLWPDGEGYLDSARSQILAQLGAPETYGAPAVLLLGLHGMGKTALLASALESLPEGWRALALNAASAETEPQLLAQLARSLGLDLDLERPTPVLWRELEDEMAARLEVGERVLLTVDDADLMDDDALGAFLEHLTPFLSPAVRLV
ncbi:MAG: AAA family ATPase, partial [Pseudomonadales bacterium]